jgi:hypothetical protein
MVRQHAPAEWIGLAERNRAHPGPLQPEAERANAAEQVEQSGAECHRIAHSHSP